jgi:molybdenum cofactor cytidylyltransferase
MDDVIAGIYLAAGRGKRFGGDKLLHMVGGRPLFSYSLDTCLDSRLGIIIVVTGPRSSKLAKVMQKRYLQKTRIRFVENRDTASGLASSLKAGFLAVPWWATGAMVLLADMPRITTTIIDRLVKTHSETPGIVIPKCGGELRHPRLFPRQYFGEFLQLADDETGVSVIDSHSNEIVPVRVGEETNYIDIDTPDDLKWFDQV